MTDAAVMGAWARLFQAIDLDGNALAGPVASVTRLEGTARQAAAGLSFDTEPASFVRLFESLVREEGAENV